MYDNMMCYDNVEETGTKDENSSIPTTTFDHCTWDSTTSLIVERELRHLERYIHLQHLDIFDIFLNYIG